MTIWLIGMSACGKTTISKKLFDRLQLTDKKWILLDGDTFRHIFGEDLGHSIEDRRKNAYRISRFCEYLSSQNINVLACVLSIFHDNQKYNKENIKNYKEVYIDVEFENLVKRDNKELYKKALDGEIKNVVGIDIEFKPPYSPDIVIDNNKDNPCYDIMVNNILESFEIKVDMAYSYTQNNLLKIPHKYQYSKFEGRDFFDKFKLDRKNSIDFLVKRYDRVSKKDNVLKLEVEEYKTPDNLILKEFLIYLLNESTVKLKDNKQIIALLIKRFEVGKKLYLTYDLKEIRKSTTEYEELLNYPLFSLVLQKYFINSNSEEKYVYLNAILKVDDIISSIKEEFIFTQEVYYSVSALKGEVEIMGEFI